MPAFVAQNPDVDAAVRESFGRLSLMSTIGARLASVAPGEVQVVLPSREELAQHHGFLSAAVLTAIADVACGYAAMSLMPAGASVLTVEYKVNFVPPAQGKRIVARARVVRPGRTVTTCTADVFAMTGAEEKLVATMLATMIQAGGEREPSSERRDTRQHVHESAVHRSSRTARSWCVCRGGGLRHHLRALSGLV